MNNNASAVRSTLSADRSRADFVMDLVALATGIAASDIRKATRGHAKAARARQIAMYLAYVAWQWPLSRIGRAFQRDRTTAGYACRLIEDLRDHTGFDSTLERLETCLKSAPEPAQTRLLCMNFTDMG